MKSTTFETLTNKEIKFLVYHLVCRLDDYEMELKKCSSSNNALNQFYALEKLIYTKIIPGAYLGAFPKYWNDPNVNSYLGE